MLRLWPKRWQLGVFNDHSWLCHGNQKVAEINDVSLDIYSSFEQLLTVSKHVLKKNDRLSMTLSDAFFRIVTLPWQDNLNTAAELNAYAKICFAMQGIVLDESWVIFSDFIRYNQPGIAYALKKDSIERLITIADAAHVCIESIQPKSASVFYAVQRKKWNETRLLLLLEKDRVSSFVYGQNGLLGCDVEVLTSKKDISVRRLLTRVQLDHQIKRISCWSATEVVSEANLNSLFQYFFADANVQFAQSLTEKY